MPESKTSTFTVHHDSCKPQDWKPRDVLMFADFIRTGDLRYAAALARLGLQLVLSEHHVPKGGTLQEVGFALANAEIEVVSDDLNAIVEGGGQDADVTEVVRVYRGPVEYAARWYEGDGDGFAAVVYELKPTEAEAVAFVASFEEEAARQASETAEERP